MTDGDEVPDLDLWLDGRPAPGADFEFIAEAREDIPRLLAALDPDNPQDWRFLRPSG
jgi:hypothetical protein